MTHREELERKITLKYQQLGIVRSELRALEHELFSLPDYHYGEEITHEMEDR